MSSKSVDDATTSQTIKDVYQQHHYTLDPHGAVAYYALENCLQNSPSGAAHCKGFILETAHPVKFPDTVEDATGRSIEFPEQVQHLLSAEKKSILMNADFNDFKEWLMNR
jgi:threonine synthase